MSRDPASSGVSRRFTLNGAVRKGLRGGTTCSTLNFVARRRHGPGFEPESLRSGKARRGNATRPRGCPVRQCAGLEPPCAYLADRLQTSPVSTRSAREARALWARLSAFAPQGDPADSRSRGSSFWNGKVLIGGLRFQAESLAASMNLARCSHLSPGGSVTASDCARLTPSVPAEMTAMLRSVDLTAAMRVALLVALNNRASVSDLPRCPRGCD